LRGEVGDGFARAFPCADGCAIDLEYNRIPEDVRREFLRQLSALTPVSYVMREVAEFSRMFDEQTISVNVRSWADCPSRRDALFRLNNVFQAMDRHRNARFFLSCDSDEICKALTDRYGSRVMAYPARTHAGDRTSVEGCQDAFIQMLLLARNRRLCVSFGSTFSEMAWWFGGCAADTEVMDKDSDVAAYLKEYDLTERSAMPLYLKEEWLKSRSARNSGHPQRGGCARSIS
jgi:hypothetical protein